MVAFQFYRGHTGHLTLVQSAFFMWFPFQYVFCCSGQKQMASISNFLVATIFSVLGTVMQCSNSMFIIVIVTE
jgi:hypothetical protein